MGNKCTHTEPGCGCVDGPMTTPPACPPLPCDNPQPCSSYTDAQCVIYTGEDIICDEQIVVENNANLNDIIIELVTRICEAAGNTTQTVVVGGDNINVSSVTVGSTTTYTVSQPSKIFFYEEFISDIDIVSGAPSPGPDDYFFPIGYEILTFQNTYLNPATFKVHVSYNTDIPSIVGFPINSLENVVDGAIVTTVGVVDTIQYETLGNTDIEIYLWDTDNNNIISGVTGDTVRTTPGDHPVDVRFTNNRKPKNTAFFKVVTLQPGEFVSLKFKSKEDSVGRLLKAQILVEEL
jgi:hypothetical protein